MKKDFSRRPSGSKKSEPKVMSVVLKEYFESDAPLAVAYRERFLGDLFPDTHLDVDIKLLTCEPGRMAVGALLDGTLLRDGEEHFVFAQQSAEQSEGAVPRNMHVHVGEFINVNRRGDGVVYPTFRYGKLFSENISFEDYCISAAKELLTVSRLFKKKGAKG